MFKKLLLTVSLPFILIGCGTVLTKAPPDVVPVSEGRLPALQAKKVVLVVLENTDAKDALAQPFLASLAQKGAYLSNYHAVAHPSQPNYMVLVSGGTQGVSGDKPPKPVSGQYLQKQSASWRVYAEGYPGSKGNCHADDQCSYVMRHVPFMSFEGVQSSALCDNIHEFSSFHEDAINPENLPRFSLVIPNLADDAHGTGAFGAAFDFHRELLIKADRWMENNFASLIGNDTFANDVLLIVTFDEDGTKPWLYHFSNDNKVYTVLLGKDVEPSGAVVNKYNVRHDHYDLHRTIETVLNEQHTETPENVNSRSILEIWKR